MAIVINHHTKNHTPAAAVIVWLAKLISGSNTPDGDMLIQNRLDSHLNLMENGNVVRRMRCLTIVPPNTYAG